jgi:GH15 family glucan-1,4-alpha-glucosidase
MPTRGHDLPISEYAIIGDQNTAALVARDGSVDWLCHERFDGAAVFCRLLDRRRGGYFSVAPDSEAVSTRSYVGNTNVLATDFRSSEGAIRVIDCMPLDNCKPSGWPKGSVLLRKVQGLSGDVTVSVDFAPTFDFAREPTAIELIPAGCSARASGVHIALTCPAPMRLAQGAATSTFRVRAGETRWVILTNGPNGLKEDAAEEALTSTVQTWNSWSARGTYPGPYADVLRRSALVLKLLIFSPTGAMVASPTTSLPETPGGVRNWDYRFTWLRDASWVVSALMDLGYHQESMAFIDWLASLRLAEQGPAVLYDVGGKIPAEERELTDLAGYLESRPVRIGNGAARQDQHDVFGEVVAAIHMCSEAMPSMRPLRPELWRLVSALADRAAEHWQHPDEGIWEVRDRPRNFLSSRLLCWTALDRALAIARRDGLSGSFEHWEDVRARLRRAIIEDGYNAEMGSFVRAPGGRELDASALLLMHYGILPVEDRRLTATVDRISRHLSTGNGILRRYATDDGLPGSEGAFTACSFWLVECLARQQRVAEAQGVFEQVVGHASDLGLLSEQIWPETGALVGNYPQALTHLALIGAAIAIARAELQEDA